MCDFSHGEFDYGGVTVSKGGSDFGATDIADDYAVQLGFAACHCRRGLRDAPSSAADIRAILIENVDQLVQVEGACRRPEDCTL